MPFCLLIFLIQRFNCLVQQRASFLIEAHLLFKGYTVIISNFCKPVCKIYKPGSPGYAWSTILVIGSPI